MLLLIECKWWKTYNHCKVQWYFGNTRACSNPLQWCHNGHNGISNHQPQDCLLNHLFRRSSKKTSKLRVTGLCAGNSPVTREFPTQMASNTEYVSIWWHHHAIYMLTHWGRVRHICISKLTIIGSDNGLSPGRRQTIIWTNAGILLIGPLGANFSETSIKILTFSFKKMRLKVSSAKWRPFCLGLNGLIMVWWTEQPIPVLLGIVLSLVIVFSDP